MDKCIQRQQYHHAESSEGSSVKKECFSHNTSLVFFCFLLLFSSEKSSCYVVHAGLGFLTFFPQPSQVSMPRSLALSVFLSFFLFPLYPVDEPRVQDATSWFPGLISLAPNKQFNAWFNASRKLKKKKKKQKNQLNVQACSIQIQITGSKVQRKYRIISMVSSH